MCNFEKCKPEIKTYETRNAILGQENNIKDKTEKHKKISYSCFSGSSFTVVEIKKVTSQVWSANVKRRFKIKAISAES